MAQHLSDALVDQDDDEAGCAVVDGPLVLGALGPEAESVTVSGPPQVMAHTTRQEWYAQYLLHRTAAGWGGGARPASKRIVRAYMRHWTTFAHCQSSADGEMFDVRKAQRNAAEVVLPE